MGNQLLDDDDVPVKEEFVVNEAFAKRFEHNKKREELHRLQAKHPELAARIEQKALKQQLRGNQQQDEEDESSSEEEDEGEIPDNTEAEIFRTLLRIKRKDPVVYNKEVAFFKEEDDEEAEEDGEGEGEEGKRKQKPMYLKDVLAKQALEYGPEGGSDDEAEEGGRRRGRDDDDAARKPKVYDAEQEALRRAFLDEAGKAAEGEEEADFAGVLRRREGGDDEEEQGAAAPAAASKSAKKAKGKKGGKGGEEALDQLLDDYFGGDEALDEGDRFLKQYILNKGWIDKHGDDYVPTYKEVVGDDDGGDMEGIDEEDEQHLQAVDKFEAAYNFRFEEPGGAAIVSHPRQIEGTVRQEDDRRKRQRAEKKKRQEEEEAGRREEVKRLKNLKKAEIQDKLGQVQKVAGIAAPGAGLVDEMLEGDFDPEEWDRRMAAAFDDDYYGAEEDEGELFAGEGGDEDALLREVLGGDGGGDSDEEGEEGGALGAGVKSVHAKLRKLRSESEDVEDDDEANVDGQDEAAAAAAAAKRAEIQRLVEQYYKLDYEDDIGGLRTRFRYRQVAPETFGLSVEDILMRDDKELNQVAGLRRLAPYHEGKARPNYKALQAMREAGPAGGDKGKHRRQQNKFGKPYNNKFDKQQQGQGQQQQGKGQGHDRRQQQHNKGAGGRQQQQGGGKFQKQGQQQGQKRPREEQAAQEAGGEQQQQQQQGQQQQHKKQQQPPKHKQPVDPKQARLASYAKLSLGKSGTEEGGKGKQSGGQQQKQGGPAAKKLKREPQEQKPQDDGPKLPKSAKKNMKRKMKRMAQKGPGQGEGQQPQQGDN